MFHVRMMDEQDGWNALQTLLRNILETVSKLETSFEKNDEDMLQRNEWEEAQDLSKVERFLQTISTYWLAKCKETEHLQLKLKRSTEMFESMNTEHLLTKDSIFDLRQKFVEAVETSITDIEELSMVNNILSERIIELKKKIEGAEKYVKEGLSTLLHAISSCKDEGVNSEEGAVLQSEIEKLKRMLAVEDLFYSRYLDSTKPLIEKSLNIVPTVTQRLNDSLKLDARVSKRSADDQIGKESNGGDENDSFLAQHEFKGGSDIDKEVNEILEYLNIYFYSQDKDSNNNIYPLPNSSYKRNILIIKRLIINFNDDFTKLHEKSKNKRTEICDLNETTRYLNEQLKKVTFKNESLEDENHVLKQKSEQAKVNHQCTIDELNAMQSRFKIIEEERNLYLDENIMLKGSMTNAKGIYHNLGDENEKLSQKLKQVQTEKDKMYSSLHEQIRKTNQYTSECKELTFKCENFENTIAKLNREYFGITREMNTLSHESDTMKKSNQEKEREIIHLKRNMRTLETNNTDLEDQLFHLTGQYQKTKYGYEKLRSNIEEYKTMIEELEEKIESIERDKGTLENEQKNMGADKPHLDEPNKNITFQLFLKEDLSEKIRIALPEYEKLLSELLRQRKEVISILQLEKMEQFDKTTLKISSFQGIENKLASEIEEYLKKQYCEIESSFDSLACYLRCSQDDWKRIEYYYSDLSHFMETIEDDSRYSNNGDFMETSPSPSPSESSKMNNRDRFKMIKTLIRKIKVLAIYASSAKEKISGMKLKTKTLVRIIHQLQLKLKHCKSVRNNKKNRLLYLSRRLKLSKTGQHICPRKRANNTFNCATENITNLSTHRSISLDNHVILKEQAESLAITESISEKVLGCMNKCVDNETRTEINNGFKKIRTCLITTINILKSIPKDSCKLMEYVSGSAMWESQINKEDKLTLVGSRQNAFEEEKHSSSDLILHASSPNKSLKYETIKRKNKLKLENTQKRIRDLSEYLKQRERELKERDKIIAKLYKEYEELKQKTVHDNVAKCSTSERIIMEYARSKNKLKKENEFLQLLTREVHEELLSIHKWCKGEEDSQIYLQNLVNELQTSKHTLQQLLDDMTLEFNIVKGEKEYLMQSIFNATLYQNPCLSSDGMCYNDDNNTLYAECNCSVQHSESSVLPFSDDEWTSAVSCGECESILSEQEYLDVVSSSDSHSTTCSKLAKNIKTSEASEKIKSENRAYRYLQKETRRGKALNPKRWPQAKTRDTSADSDVTSTTNMSPLSNRVLGRRESKMGRGIQDSSLRLHEARFYNKSASGSSKESSTSSPGPDSITIRNSLLDVTDRCEYPVGEHDITGHNVDIIPFLNPTFHKKKRRKKFLQFGRR